jgi:hypothetical protein
MRGNFPWVRLYRHIICPQWARFTDTEKAIWVECLVSADPDTGDLSDDVGTAYMIRRPLDTVTAALRTFINAGWAMESEGMYSMPSWDERQPLSDKDPTNAARQRKYREKKRNDARNALRNGDVTGDVTRAEETRVDKNRLEETTTTLVTTATAAKVKSPNRETQCRTVFDFWRETWEHHGCKLSKARKKVILQRLADGYSVQELCMAIAGFKFDDWQERHNMPVRHSVAILLRELVDGSRDNVEVGLEYFNAHRAKALRLLPPEMGVQVAQSYMELYSGNVIQRLVGMGNGDDKALHDMSKATLTLHAYEALARTADPKADYSDIRERMLAGKPPTPPMEFDMPEEVGRLIADQYGPPVMMEVGE